MSNEMVLNNSAIVARAELDTQISTARAYPRNSSTFIERATFLATMDEETAESCIYCLPRKDKDGKTTEIKGESVRLAEIAASCWGNIHTAARIIGNDGRFITAEAVCWDLENNVRMGVEVKRRITTSAGKTFSDDMQVVTGNAACSIALRNAILKVVPRALIKKVYSNSVNFAIGDQKTIGSKKQKVFERFQKMGIGQEKILTYLEKKTVGDVTADDLEKLIGIGTAIKQGEIKIDKAFSLDEDSEKGSPADIVDKQKTQLSDLEKNLPSQQQPQVNNFNKETGEIDSNGAAPEINLESIRAMMKSAKSRNDLDAAVDFARSLPEAEKEKLKPDYMVAMENILKLEK